MEQLSQHIESLVFTSQGPITFAEIKEALEDSFETKFKKAAVQTAIDDVLEKYKSDVFSFEIVEIANGYQFFTKGAYHGTVGSRLKLTSKKRLSRAALETLAVIAYKQPVIKSECEKIRGVSCDYTIQKLLEKELISITGRADTPGRPLLYGTSQKFMDYFGLKDISELPKPKDFQLPDQEIGDAAPIEELSEEQRAEKTIALEEMTDQVAAAILGEAFFPAEENEEVITAEEVANDEETAPEAAVDDEPEDTPSEEIPPVLEDTEVHVEFEKQYDYKEEIAVSDFTGETVTAMSPEEEAALLAEDAKIEEEESSDETDEELSEEEDDAMALEIEEELKEIIEQEEEEGLTEDADDMEEEEVTDEVPYEFIYENQTDAIAAMVASLSDLTFEPVNNKQEVIEEASYKFVYENETAAIAAIIAVLPDLDFSIERKSENAVIGVSEKELIAKPPIIDKIIEEEEDKTDTIANVDVSSDVIESSGKKKL